MPQFEVETFPQGDGPFGATTTRTYFYDDDGNPADEAVATRLTTTYADAAGHWVGCAQGIVGRPPER